MRKELLINKKRLICTFMDLININSPSFEEGRIGDHLEDAFRGLGFRVTRQSYDRSFNIIAFKKGSLKKAAPLLLSAHMDTIEPTEGIRYAIKGNVIRSVGETVLGADDKSAIAQILEAMTVMKKQDIPHGDIEVVLTSAEEKGLFGAKGLDFRKIKSRFALVLDSGGPVGRIVVSAPTQISYEMRVVGRPAHAGIEPERGINAIRVAAEIIAAVPDGRIDSVTTANIGLIRGGTATNVVPKEVLIHGEVRSHDSGALRTVKNAIFDSAKNIAKKRSAKVHIKAREEYRTFRISEKEPFLAFMDSIFLKSGIEPEHTATGGGSDANIFNQHGIVTLNLSTGMQKVHSHDEFIHIDDLLNGSIVVAAAVRDFVEFRK